MQNQTQQTMLKALMQNIKQLIEEAVALVLHQPVMRYSQKAFPKLRKKISHGLRDLEKQLSL